MNLCKSNHMAFMLSDLYIHILNMNDPKKDLLIKNEDKLSIWIPYILLRVGWWLHAKLHVFNTAVTRCGPVTWLL